LLKDDGGASLAAYHSWQEKRALTIDAASKPRFEVFLASQATAPPPIAFTVEYVPGPARVASGKRFGALVHAALRDVALDAGAAAIRRVADLNGRILGSPPSEVESAITAIERALTLPLLQRARAAKRCHREYPISLDLADGRLLEGVIDFAFVE